MSATEDINVLIVATDEATPAIAEAIEALEELKKTEAMLEREQLRVELYPTAELVDERFTYGGQVCISPRHPIKVRAADVTALLEQGFSDQAPAPEPEKE